MTTDTVAYVPIDRTEREGLWTQSQAERKWDGVIRSLMAGEHLFVPTMSRGQLETLRSILKDHGISSLRSRFVKRDDGTEGRILRLK